MTDQSKREAVTGALTNQMAGVEPGAYPMGWVRSYGWWAGLLRNDLVLYIIQRFLHTPVVGERVGGGEEFLLPNIP